MTSFTVTQAKRTDKKLIQGFYRENNYRAGFLGNDTTLMLTVEQRVIGCVIISVIDDQPFLHGLVINDQFQHQGLASVLIRQAQQTFKHLVCFASPKLENLYLSNDFRIASKENIHSSLLNRYVSYKKHKANLCIYQFVQKLEC